MPKRANDPRSAPRRRTTRWAVALLIVTSCTGEEPEPIDLNATIPPTSAPDDPNAEVREDMRQLAVQQCIDDPELEVGTVRIIDPVTNEMVSEFTLPCDEVRNP